LAAVLLATSGVMVTATSAPIAAAIATSRYVAIAPTRMADTRSGAPIAAETSRDIQITGSLVPAEALPGQWVRPGLSHKRRQGR
jgi:hypothetical protein